MGNPVRHDAVRVVIAPANNGRASWPIQGGLGSLGYGNKPFRRAPDEYFPISGIQVVWVGLQHLGGHLEKLLPSVSGRGLHGIAPYGGYPVGVRAQTEWGNIGIHRRDIYVLQPHAQLFRGYLS